MISSKEIIRKITEVEADIVSMKLRMQTKKDRLVFLKKQLLITQEFERSQDDRYKN